MLPRRWHSWLLDQGSLTLRLQRLSQGDFRVRVCQQGWAYPQQSEYQALGLASHRQALVREVELLCKGQVWVRARSVIPHTTLCGEERQLQYLGTKPLGAFLFKSRAMQRKNFQLASFSTENGQRCYGRRSLFLLHQKPLLVSEIFMPIVLQEY